MQPSQRGMNEGGVNLSTYFHKLVGILPSLGPLHLCKLWIKSGMGLHGNNTGRDNRIFLFGAQQRTELKRKGRRGLSPRAQEKRQETSPVWRPV